MSEVSYSSISTPSLGRELLNKSYKNAYSIVADKTYTKPEVENKELIYLTRSINRMEQNMDFMQREHCLMLEGLQKQIEKLREENQELQFQLVMRADRPCETDLKVVIKAKDPATASSKLTLDQISQLQSALEDEKRKNKVLLEQLESSLNRNDNGANVEQKSEQSSLSEDGVHISSDIRISLNPLAVSTYQHDSGRYLMKNPLTIQDCEMVIRKLLQKVERNPSLKERSDSITSRASSQRQKLVPPPAPKKPLQPIKPLTCGAAAVKFNHQSTLQTPTPLGLPSTKKLMPILSDKQEPPKIEQSPRRQDLSRRSDNESKELGQLPSIFTEGKTGTSLPALPKPHDYNQADRHRRVHLLQRKRLDQCNNRS